MPTVNLTGPQSEFMTLHHDSFAPSIFNLLVAGFGSGKSETLILNSMTDLLQYPGANVGIYSPTYDLMRLILLPRFEQYLDQMGYRYVMNKTEWIMSVDGYGWLIFRSLDKESRIIGYEHFSAHIDEIDTLKMQKAEGVWLKILARNRQIIPGHEEMRNKIGVYTTPEGFNFTYKYWSPNGEANRRMDDNGRAMYKYIKAPTYSNPHLPSGYVDSLRATYPDSLIDAYIEGEWVNLSSGRVYPKYDKILNGCETVPTETETIHLGMDFNVQRGCSVAHVLRPGPYGEEAHAVFEIYNAYDTPAQIKIAKERFPENDVIVYPDASGKHRHSSNATESDFKAVTDGGFRLKQYNWNGYVKDRVTAFNGMICNGEQHRRYKVNLEACPNLNTGLETQVYDDNGMPEKGPGKWDDVNDAPGYFIGRKFPIVKPKAVTTAVQGRH